MQQLHLVGFTTDSESLILSVKKGAKSGSYAVPLDERLLEVIADAVRRRNADDNEKPLPLPPELTPPPAQSLRTSALSPRELQARLRAGRTVAQVAREAGADEDWVAKFEPPVMAERARIITRARQLTYAKPRRGESAEPLGLAVRWNLADRGIRLTDGEFDAGWSASLIGDTTWEVTFTFVSRSRRQVAEWEIDLHDHDVVARNRLASDLAYAEPGRRRRLSAFVPPPDAVPQARGDAEQASGGKSAARARRVTKKSAPRAAKKAAPRRGATRTGAAKTKRTKKAAKTAKAATKSAKRARRPREDDVTALVTRRAPAVTPPANELARRRLELVGKHVPAARPARAPVLVSQHEPPSPRRRPERADRGVADPDGAKPSADGAPDGASEAVAEQTAATERREERRRARAARVAEAAASSAAKEANGARPRDTPAADEEARVVTIRASQAGTAGDVVVRDGARPLRPALPAAQPKRRRFTRNR